MSSWNSISTIEVACTLEEETDVYCKNSGTYHTHTTSFKITSWSFDRRLPRQKIDYRYVKLRRPSMVMPETVHCEVCDDLGLELVRVELLKFGH